MLQPKQVHTDVAAPALQPPTPTSSPLAPPQPLTFNVINITWHLSIFFAGSGGQKASSKPPPHPLLTTVLPARQQMGSRVPAEQSGRRRFPLHSPPQRSPVDNSCTANINNFANNLIWEKDAQAAAWRHGMEDGQGVHGLARGWGWWLLGCS